MEMSASMSSMSLLLVAVVLVGIIGGACPARPKDLYGHVPDQKPVRFSLKLN